MHRTLFCGRSKGAHVQPHTYKHHAHKHTQNTLVIRTHARMHACTRAHARSHTHRLEEAEKDPERASSARPNSRSWKYSDLRKPPPHMRPSHGKKRPIKQEHTKIRKQKKGSWCSNLAGPAPLRPDPSARILTTHARASPHPHAPGDIPAWAPKVYPRAQGPSTSVDEGFQAWPQVCLTGRKTPRPKSTQWAATERVDPLLGCRSRLFNADVRLAVPNRETVSNKGMASHLLSINRKVDHHGELCGHTSNTPLFSAHRVRAISLPRGGRGM